MILKVVGVLQLILIQVISAQVSARDLVIQNVLNNLENIRLAGCSRPRRQINNPPVDFPGTGDLPVKEFANGLSFKNDRSFGNFARGHGSPNNLALNKVLPISSMGLPNSLPMSSNINMPKYLNKLLPNDNNNNRLPINNIPNSMPSFNNFPNGLPGFNNVPNGRPSVNILPNGLPSFNNVPNGLSGLNNIPRGLPGVNNIPRGLPGVNNIPSGLPGFNNVPNVLPGFNNLPNGLPSFNNLPSGLPSFNNVPNGLPDFNNIPSGLPGVNNIPKAMPGLNIMPNELPNNYNLPGTNKFQNLINVPAGNNVLNSNILPNVNSLPNINNIPITNSLTSFYNSPCGIAYPVPLKNKLPQNTLQIGNILPSSNNKLPFLNNLQITEIGTGNGYADVNRLPRNDQLNGNVLYNANYLKNVRNRSAQHSSNEFSNINGFSVLSNTPSITEVSNNAQAINMFSSGNNIPDINGVSNFVGEAENINTMQLNNGMGDVSNFQNLNMMPINEQRFVSNISPNNGFAVVNHFPANTEVQNANSRLINAITNDTPLSNGGYLDDILFANNAVNTQETLVQNSDGNIFSSNDVQFGNVQVPVNDWRYETVATNLPAMSTQIVLPEGVHMVTNVPSEYQPGLMSNSLSLAKELVGNLQIEGLDSMPFLNGLPVAGITETVTVLNR